MFSVLGTRYSIGCSVRRKTRSITIAAELHLGDGVVFFVFLFVFLKEYPFAEFGKKGTIPHIVVQKRIGFNEFQCRSNYFDDIHYGW